MRTNSRPVALAIDLPSEVLPTPGGPQVGPGASVAPGGAFESYRVFELFHDTMDRERRGLASRRMYRAIAPWVQENPLIFHAGSAAPDAVRRAALVRLWDLSDRVRFLADPSIPTHDLCVELPGGTGLRRGSEAGRALLPVLPGFWWMYPWCLLPGLSSLCGWLVARTFR